MAAGQPDALKCASRATRPCASTSCPKATASRAWRASPSGRRGRDRARQARASTTPPSTRPGAQRGKVVEADDDDEPQRGRRRDRRHSCGGERQGGARVAHVKGPHLFHRRTWDRRRLREARRDHAPDPRRVGAWTRRTSWSPSSASPAISRRAWAPDGPQRRRRGRRGLLLARRGPDLGRREHGAGRRLPRSRSGRAPRPRVLRRASVRMVDPGRRGVRAHAARRDLCGLHAEGRGELHAARPARSDAAPDARGIGDRAGACARAAGGLPCRVGPRLRRDA